MVKCILHLTQDPECFSVIINTWQNLQGQKRTKCGAVTGRISWRVGFCWALKDMQDFGNHGVGPSRQKSNMESGTTPVPGRRPPSRRQLTSFGEGWGPQGGAGTQAEGGLGPTLLRRAQEWVWMAAQKENCECDKQEWEEGFFKWCSEFVKTFIVK